MGGIKVEYRNDEGPRGLTQATQDGGGMSQGIGNFCRGSRVSWRCRFAEAYINGNTAPAPDPLQWEGPFVRITPLWGTSLGSPNANRMAQGKRSRGTMANASTPFVASGGAVAPLGEQPMYYDIDAFGQSGLYLPFDATLEFWTVRAGVYIFDTWEIPGEYIDPPTYRQTFTQSRWSFDGQTRRVSVPFGAQELAVIGQPANGQVVGEQEDTGKTVALGNSLIPIDMFASGSAGMRIPCGGMRTVAFAAAAGDVLGVVFYITI